MFPPSILRDHEVAGASVLIIGGYGEAGRRVARLLVRRTPARITVAGPNGMRARSLADELGEKVDAIALDATDALAVRRALEGVTLLVLCASLPRHASEIAEAAMAAGADWLDVQVHAGQTAALEALRSRIGAAGRCFITQGGFHPGVPAALVRWAAAQYDQLETAHCMGSVRDRGGMPDTSGVRELIEGLSDFRSARYRNGRWQPVRGWTPSDYPAMQLGFGFGRRRGAWWQIDELTPLPAQIPSLRELGFTIATNPLTDYAAMPAAMAITAIAGNRHRALTAAGWLVAWSTRLGARPPFGTVVQLDATGRRHGTPVRLAVRLFHEDAYDLTAIPVSSMAEQLLDGSARRPGLHLMGLTVDPTRLLRDAGEMGVQVEIEGARGPTAHADPQNDL